MSKNNSLSDEMQAIMKQMKQVFDEKNNLFLYHVLQLSYCNT